MEGDSHRPDELQYSRGTRTVQQLSDDVADLWRELETAAALQEAVARMGFQLADVIQYKDRLIQVRQRRSGLTGAEALIAVVLLPEAKRMASDLWSHVFLPRIVARWGVRAVGSKKRPGSPSPPKSAQRRQSSGRLSPGRKKR